VTEGTHVTDDRAPAPAAQVQRRAHRWQPAFQATGMSAFVALVVTAINTGVDAHLVARWLHAWRLALPAAIVAAYLFRPLAWRIALLLARWSARAA
jgi:cation transporter-like permease